MNGTDIFPQARDHALIKSPQSAHSWGGRTRYSVTLPPQNTLQLLSFFDCILLCTTVCTRSCVLSYCCVFQAGKHKAWLAANSGGASLSLSAQWNLCRATRKVFVGERFSFCCERFSRQLLLCRNHLLLFSTLLLLLCLSSLDDDSVARGGASQSRADKQEGNATLILLPFLFLSIPSFFSPHLIAVPFSLAIFFASDTASQFKL